MPPSADDSFSQSVTPAVPPSIVVSKTQQKKSVLQAKFHYWDSVFAS